MSLSIIIPLFNKAPFIANTLTCLIGQLAPEDDLLVVDDCSTDDGPAIVLDIAHPQVRLVRTQRNDGPGTARNLGAQVAHGTHLLFFDADDLPRPHLLAELRAAIAQHPTEVLWAYDIAFQAHAEIISNDLVHNPTSVKTRVMPRDAFALSCLAGKPICTASSTCVRADAFHAAGGFQSGLRYCEDPELWARLSAAHPLVHIEHMLATYRDVTGSLSYDLRAQPGSVEPYVRTLFTLADGAGDAYRRLAVSMITRNAIFSIALGGNRRNLRTYLAHVSDMLPPGRAFLLWLLSTLPRIALRLPLAWRKALVRFRKQQAIGKRRLARLVP